MPNKSILISAYAFYPDFGGLEQQIYLLAKEFMSQGYSVDVLTEKSSKLYPSKEVIDGITVYRLPYVGRRSIFAYATLIFGLSYFIIKNRNAYSFIVLRAALTLYPVVFGFWKKIGVIKIATWVTADTGGAFDEIIQLSSWPFLSVLINLCKSHTYLNSICADNAKHYLQLGIPANKLTNISNGIDITMYKKSEYPLKVKTFLFLGRLIKEKGIFELLTAFKALCDKYQDVKLIIGGDGPEKTAIVEFITKNNLQTKIVYVGLISNREKNSFFSKGECLVQPSYTEGFGLVYAEAAARKKVIISTDVADLMKNYASQIYYCEKKSHKSVYKALETVFLADSFKHLNYDAIVKEFDIKRTSAQILNLM